MHNSLVVVVTVAAVGVSTDVGGLVWACVAIGGCGLVQKWVARSCRVGSHWGSAANPVHEEKGWRDSMGGLGSCTAPFSTFLVKCTTFHVHTST